MSPDLPTAERASPSPPGRLRGHVGALWGALGRRPELEAWRLRDEWPWPALVALGLLLVYAWCAPRTVALEDDGLFILASYFNGIAHPPGYPVFTLIGHLFAQLPFGSVAWRVHLVSALFGALTCAVLWCIVRSLVPSRAIATAAALAYGFSEAFWSQAIIAEVYTLNTFITFLLVWLLLRLGAAEGPGGTTVRELGWYETGLLGLIYGIGLSNHWPLLVLFSPAYLLLGWPLLGSLWRRAPALLLGLGLGLLPYLWLYLRSQMEPEISFFGPIEGWSEFFQFVSRSTYGGADHEPGVGWSDKLGYLGFQGTALVAQFTPLGAGLALVGLVAPGRQRQPALALLLGAVCVSLLLIMLLDREYALLGTFIYRVYPLPAYGVCAVLIALGLGRVLPLVARLPTESVRRALVGGLLAAVVGLPLLVHAARNSRGDYLWAEHFARAALDEVPANGILLLHADLDALPVGYVRLVLGYRPDVDIYSTQSLLFRDRPFDPWEVRDEESRQAALIRIVNETQRDVCFIGIKGRFGNRLGLRWNGLTACYDRERKEVYSRVTDQAIERYIALQSSRDADGWTMMGADSIDGQMVHVLVAESFFASEEERPRLYEAIDRARYGLRGKLAFIRYSLDAGVALSTDQSLALLEEAQRQADRAYVKQDLIDLYQLAARELERAGREDEAWQMLWRGVAVKPAWRNELLPRVLTELFAAGREAELRNLAALDSDFKVLEEIYDFYVANRDQEGFGLTMKREGLTITLQRDGTFRIE